MDDDDLTMEMHQRNKRLYDRLTYVESCLAEIRAAWNEGVWDHVVDAYAVEHAPALRIQKALAAAEAEFEEDDGTRRCARCGEWTTALEARLRNVHQGRCGACGGILVRERGAAP